jgi:kynureninase
MEPGFKPMQGAEGWQLSNAPVFSMAVHRAALDLFDRTSITVLCEKTEKLTGFFEFVVDEVSQMSEGKFLEIITPQDPAQRGCQISILAHGAGRELYEKLMAKGVVVDFREPNVIRAAPVPMYNSFMDVYEFGVALKEAVE